VCNYHAKTFQQERVVSLMIPRTYVSRAGCRS